MSVRAFPGTDTFLAADAALAGIRRRATVCSSLDTDGNVLSGEGTPNSELWIHARTYAARPDLGSVVHAHPPACVCLTQIGQPHRVVHNQGGVFADGVAAIRTHRSHPLARLGDLPRGEPGVKASP